ncbi:MAG TPA: LysM peptidoglycan-binding domain-containing protein [Verrucomicrobiae bacterium]|nr:LysM peptidoglycan-binding domain-containing protein [Verrucomicrobiae bacterium]
MNASNPFQIPTAYQIDIENRRRARVKKTVIITVGATAALLVGLLIEGCVSEHSKSAAMSEPMAIADSAPAPTVKTAVANSIPQPVPAAQPANVPPAGAVTPASKAAETIYIVQSGDTLGKIAKTRGTTVKALKSANGLNSDKIVVGEKLKIPTA